MKFRLLILFAPWLLAVLFQSNSQLSYLIAWGGSILNLVLFFSGFLHKFPDDKPVANQLLRPIFISQIIFVSYLSLTSIFFFLNSLGYDNFIKNEFYLINHRVLNETAASQRIYSLAHASYSLGLLLFLNYRRKYKWKMNNAKVDANFFLKMALVLTLLKFVFLYLPGLSQFAIKATDIAYISSIIALAYKSDNKKYQFYILALSLFAFNFISILLGGWKEPIIFTLILLAAYFYPTYKKVILVISIPAIVFVMFVLPSFNNQFRALAWSEGIESTDAAQSAIDLLQSGEVDVSKDNWSFLVERASEISMFNDYMRKVPNEKPYYGNAIIKDSFRFILPRIFWPEKPNVEEHVMKRAYDAGVINQQMLVSAKPPIVVDAYLSGGALYVALILFAYGLLTTYLSGLCEYLFGGYELGSAWVFLGFFQILNRGNCMEFLVNSIFWGVISMYIMQFVLKKLNYLIPTEN